MSFEVVGEFIGCIAATVWGLAATSAAPKNWRPLCLTLIWSIDAALLATALVLKQVPGNSPSTHPFAGGLYGVDVLIEVIAILATVGVLRRFRQQRFISPAVGLIVGLHFVGLWCASEMPVFLWLACALCVAAALAFALGGRLGHLRGVEDGYRLLTGSGSALVFWIVCTASLWLGART